MNTRRYTFKKGERLTSKNLIASLFDENQYDGIVKHYPFIVTWKFEKLDNQYPAQILLVVSKKFSRKATNRSRIKRQMREIYRSHKHDLYDFLSNRNQQIILALIFTGKKFFSYQTLEQNFEKILEKLKSNIEENDK